MYRHADERIELFLLLSRIWMCSDGGVFVEAEECISHEATVKKKMVKQICTKKSEF